MATYWDLTGQVLRDEALPPQTRRLSDDDLDRFLDEAVGWATKVVGSPLPKESTFLRGAIRDLAASIAVRPLFGTESPDASKIADSRRDDALKRLRLVAESIEPEQPGGDTSSGEVINRIPEMWPPDRPLLPPHEPSRSPGIWPW